MGCSPNGSSKMSDKNSSPKNPNVMKNITMTGATNVSILSTSANGRL